MDEQQVIDDAVEALREIREGFRGERVADLAGGVSQLIRPTMAFDSSLEEASRRREKMPREFAEKAAEIVGRNSKVPAYKTPVFKCLEDYEKCIKHSKNSNVCIALMVVCVCKHLIPFVRHK
jgi:hypothetical protein